MMPACEKSDPAKVAKKLANKAEESGAEPMEPRAGAEGKAGHHGTDRTQLGRAVSRGSAGEKARQPDRARSHLHQNARVQIRALPC